ncbi:MAG: glycosyltransferase family 2 protein [Anaerotruncus sp.]|nr:glycosyltransferase family 2 protein [Anaerotruncus sp.]
MIKGGLIRDMKPIKACFIMLAYNTPEFFLRQAIESILNQTVPEWVLLIRDNGSNDGTTAAIIQEYAQKDSRILCCRNEINRAPTKQELGRWHELFEQYILSGSAEYFAFLDSDDTYAPEFLEVMYRKAQKCQAELVICGTTMVNETSKAVLKQVLPPDLFLEKKSLTSDQFYQLYGSFRTLWGKLYHSCLFRAYLGAFNRVHRLKMNNGGDTHVVLQLLCKINRLVCVPQSLHTYYIRNSSYYKTTKALVPIRRIKDGEQLFLRACLTAKAYCCLTQKTVDFLYLVYEYHIHDLLDMVLKNTAMTEQDKIAYFQAAINAPLFAQIDEHSKGMRLMLSQQLAQMITSGLPISAEQYPQLSKS